MQCLENKCNLSLNEHLDNILFMGAQSMCNKTICYSIVVLFYEQSIYKTSMQRMIRQEFIALPFFSFILLDILNEIFWPLLLARSILQ